MSVKQTDMKTIVSIIVYSRTENIKRWISCWQKCDNKNAELVVIHNTDEKVKPDKIKALCDANGIKYFERDNFGMDIGAFKDVCGGKIKGFPEFDNLLWITDDVVPMAKDFIKPYTSLKGKDVGVVCLEISEIIKTHIRTSAFLIDKETASKLKFAKLLTKVDCYEFEHRSRDSFYEQVIGMGKKVIQAETLESASLWDTGQRSNFKRWDEHNKAFTEKKGNKICIVTTFDRNYKEGGKTLFNSIRRHTDVTNVDFKVITADEEVLKEFGKDNCHFVTDKIKARYANVQYSPPLPEERYAASWYRFEMFSLSEYDRVICIDSDCICIKDISYLFSDELNEYDLISVEDHIVSRVFTKVLPQLEKQGCDLTSLKKRLSEGKIDIQPALLVANKSIVNEKWYKKLLHYANTTPFSYSIDEGVLNDFVYMENLKIKLLPLEWDYQDCYEAHCPGLPVPSDPYIVHCQESKPFKNEKNRISKHLHRWHDLWWKESRPIALDTPDLVVDSILDKMAIKHTSDKSSKFHNYAVKYDKILSPFKDQYTSILEIGVAYGQSVRMWTDYFPNAVIHAADIEKSFKSCESYSNRIKFHLLDQRSRIQLKGMEQFGPFDLIIDDGNHFWSEQILTFETLFPYLKQGGIYIVEDTTTSYWNEYKNYHISTVEYFKKLVDDVHLHGRRGSVPGNAPREFGDWEKGWHRREDCHTQVPEFESIQFMNGFIVIYKR